MALAGYAGIRRAVSWNPLRRFPVLRVIVRRFLVAVPLLFIVSFLSFLLVSLTPGDAAEQILGVNKTPETYAQLRRAMGLDEPLYAQYWHWLDRALHGDLGVAILSGEEVAHAIGVRLPVTLSLILGSLLITLVVGVSLGVIAAVRGGAIARAIDGFTLAGFAMPAFWVASILIVLLAVKVQWFPAAGYVPFAQSGGEWLRSLVLPTIALGLGGIAAVAKQTREAMSDVLATEYVRMARANGVPESRILFRHGLKNAGVRITTILGLQTVALLSGTVVVESVFALPGLGGLVVEASLSHDLATVQGVTVYFTVIVVVVNLAIDLAYTMLNPRVRTS